MEMIPRRFRARSIAQATSLSSAWLVPACLWLERNDISTTERIDIVGPLGHHGATLLHVLRAVIGSTYCILLFVRELTFDHIGPEPHFVERGRGHRSEAMNSGAATYGHPVSMLQQLRGMCEFAQRRFIGSTFANRFGSQ